MRQAYETSLDRAGFALAAGAAAGGAFAAAVTALGSGISLVEIVVGLLVGMLVTTMAATAIGGPVWLTCPALGLRGPGTAIWVGGLCGFALFLGGQTYGFGLFDMPPTDSATLVFRRLGGVVTSLILAAVPALIGWTMGRVAYRRAG